MPIVKFDLLLKNGCAFINGELVYVDIAVADGKIAALKMPGGFFEEENAKRIYDAEGKIILPGTVDPHVHIRAPGMEEREDFYSGTAAAAAGGVTTIIEHPIANPPQYSLEILKKRIESADENSVVDFAFYGAAGAEFPDKVQELSDSRLIVSFKTFLHEAPNGRKNEFIGLTMKNDVEQYEGMRNIHKTGMICGVHAENNDMIKQKIKDMKEAGQITGIAHAYSRPPITEYETVSKLLIFAHETGARIEFCHISTPEAMEMIKQAKAKGLDVYLETCPHYLLMDESYIEQYGPFAKCNPPLRSKESVEKLWKYINDGSVDFIGSDHAPYTYEEKCQGKENIFNCPAGIPCIEMRLPLMMNAVNDKKLSLKKMVELLCINPAKVFGLYPRKGMIQIGADADFTVVDMNEEYIIKTEDMYTKSKKSARVFEGMKLKGRVKATIVRGNIVMENGYVKETNKGWGTFLKPLYK